MHLDLYFTSLPTVIGLQNKEILLTSYRRSPSAGLSRSPSTTTGMPAYRAYLARSVASSVKRPSKKATCALDSTALIASGVNSSGTSGAPGVFMHVRVPPAIWYQATSVSVTAEHYYNIEI